MLESEKQPPGIGGKLKERVLSVLKKYHILPQSQQAIKKQEPEIHPPSTIKQPPEVATPTISSTIRVDQPPVEIRKVPESPIDRVRQSFRARVPEELLSHPETIDSFDELFFSQLGENLDRYDVSRYMVNHDNEISYALPFEMRLFGGEYYPFIPRVASWYFIRALPVYGEHSPLAETYGMDDGHIRAVRLRGLLEKQGIMNMYKNLGTYFNENDPEVIGSKTAKTRTPFHRMYLSENGITFELQAPPTIEQTQRLERMRDRLSSVMTVNIKVKKAESAEPLPKPAEIAEEMPLDFIDFSEYSIPINRDMSVEAMLDPSNRIVVRSHNPNVSSPMIYGYGYIQEELRQLLATGNRHVVVFFFDKSARRHSEALGGFILSKIPEERYKRNRMDDHDKQLQDELPPIGEEKTLPDRWHLRPEIIKHPLPYTIKVDELEIPCGFRAMIDTQTGELTVEVLSDRRTLEDPIKHKLLLRVADKAAKALKERGVYVTRRANRNGDIESAVGKVLPVHV